MANRSKSNQQAVSDLAYEKGLPASLDCERFILGSILLNDTVYDQVVAALQLDDFSLEKNRRIFARMADLKARGERIDRVTVANELQRQGQLESVDGLGYLVSLDDGLPEIANLESYCRIVKHKAGLRKIIFAAQRVAKRAMLDEDEPGTLIEDVTQKLQEIASQARPDNDEGQSVEEYILSYEGGLGAFMDPSTRKLGLMTGYTRIDEMLGGFHDHELIILAARPAVGKSLLMTNIAQHMLIEKHKYVAIFSFEMSKEAVLTRMMCSIARVDHNRFRSGYLNREERIRLQEAMYTLTQVRLRIYDKASMTDRELIRTIRRLATDEGLHCSMIDHVGLVNMHTEYENRNQAISRLSRDLKMLAMETGPSILALNQLSRAPEKRGGAMRPILSDLRDSGELEQSADVVIFIFREWLYRKREDLRNQAEVIISKQRNGEIGQVPLVFMGNMMRFENKSYEPEEAQGTFAETK